MSSLSNSRTVGLFDIGLKVIWYLNFAFITFIVIFTIYQLSKLDGVSPILDIPIYFSVEVEESSLPGSVSYSDVEIENAVGQLQINNPKSYHIVLFLFAISSVKFSFTLYVILLLRRILFSVREGNPFIFENGRRLKNIAIVTLCYGLFLSLYSSLTNIFISTGISLPSIDVMYKLEIHWEYIYWGLFTFVLAEVFRIGVNLKQEQDLTI